MKWCAIAIAIALLSGCMKDPFAAEVMPPLQNPQPTTLRTGLMRTLPMKFTTDDTLIVHVPFHDDLAFLGVLKVDRSIGTFEFVALNHMGIKLFDLKGDRNSVSVAYLLPPLQDYKKIFLMVASDFQHIYLDLVPSTEAKALIEWNDVLYSEATPAGTLVYKLGGNPTVLLQKRLVGFWGTIWRVRYFRYSDESGALYPRGIVMDNERYHYRIIVKNRDVEFEP